MLTREEAWELLCDWTPSERLRIPARSMELVMRDRGEVAEGLRMLMEALGGTEDEHIARVVAALKSHATELGLTPA